MPGSIEDSITPELLKETISRQMDTLENYLPEVANGTQDRIGIE